MVDFIIGRCGSGKTFEIFNRIAEKIKNGENNVVLLVPEQFTFECEKALLEFCGAKSSLVQVVSFTKLCNIVLNTLGGAKADIIDDNYKKILIGIAIKNVKDSLMYFDKCRVNNNLCRDISAIITEFKQAGLTADDVSALAENTQEYNLSAKLRDFSLIMRAYGAIIENKFYDSETLADIALEKSIDSDIFKDKRFFVDSFTGFTVQQRKIVEQIIKKSPEVCFSFCADSISFDSEVTVFSNIKKEIDSLLKTAKKFGVAVKTPTVLERKKPYDLDFLEKVLSGESTAFYDGDAPNIEICCADTKYSEIDYVAAKISKAVREKGYRYKDFAVVSADADDYKGIIDAVFSKYNIPCYIDRKTEMRNLPLMTLVLCAVKLLTNFETETVFKMLKTGLFDLSDSEISDIEDYVYIWGINGKRWFDEFDMNPNGLEASGDSLKTEETLKNINEIRKKIIEPFIEFKNSFGNNAVNNSIAIYNMLQKINAPEKLKKYAEDLKNDGNILESEIQTESWDSLISILDRISDCYKNEPISVSEYYDVLLHNSIDQTVGTVPQHTDEVIFGSADRMRTGFIKSAFLIGVNQGVFPVLQQSGGLLSAFDREKIIKGGVNIPDRSISDIVENQYRFYNSAATPASEVYFTYNSMVEGGQASSVIDEIKKCMPSVRTVSYSDGVLPDIENIYAEEPLFEKTVQNFNKEISADYKYYFENNDDYKRKTDAINTLFNGSDVRIDKNTAERLYKNSLYISASKIDTFYKCKFSYFCRYGLKINALKKAEISAVIRGTVAHFILEKVIQKNKDSITELDRQTVNGEVDKAADEYFEILGVDCEKLGQEFMMTLKSIKVLVADLILQIADEFSKSDFKILDCETEIGLNSDIKPIKFSCDNSKTVTVTGKIDRVDGYEEDGRVYLRVVDYKTNSKVFDLSDVLYGQNLQMLLYLYILLENTQNSSPAGILYLPIKKLYDDREKNKMNGLLIKDVGIINHMSKNPSEFLPAKINAKGEFDRYSKVIGKSEFETVFRHIKRKIVEMGNSVFSGDVSIAPLNGTNGEACKYCEFRAVCKKDITAAENSITARGTEELLNTMKNCQEDGE